MLTCLPLRICEKKTLKKKKFIIQRTVAPLGCMHYQKTTNKQIYDEKDKDISNGRMYDDGNRRHSTDSA